ncbi:MAG: ribonuclease HII [Actinomycetales bacterium]|nr:ribonuclease HII [Actinomycetales bacterium]
MLRSGASLLACLDEVGRGALSGPVTVGAVVVTASSSSAPRGVRDSKELTAAARAALVPAIERWAHAHAVGHASAEEIDAIGIMAALRRAARRSLAGLGVTPDAVLLDGNHDYLSTMPDLLDALSAEASVEAIVEAEVPPVATMVKADRHCAGVAAASVLAKVARDRIMAQLAEEHPAYGWDVNKGYATPVHLDALARLGASPYHRRSWRLPAPDLTSDERRPS